MKVRGFEIAKGWENRGIRLPRRSTAHAAAYDLEAAEDVVVPVFRPGIKPTMIPTGLKAYCQPDEYYMIANRSSGAGKGLVTANGIGIIDADYYENPSNDGHFQVLVFNVLDHEITVKKGERVAQLVFQKFLLADDDKASGKRQGGFGSTDRVSYVGKSKGGGRLAVFYDLDDTLWSINPRIAEKMNIDHELLDEFRTRENTHLTAEQIEEVITSYQDAYFYETAPFFEGVEKILDLESELGAEVRIVSNSFSQEIAEVKRRRLLEQIPGLTEKHLFLHVTSPQQTHKKAWPFTPTVLVDDSPYNVASSPAKHNLIPKMCYNTTEKALGVMREKSFTYTTYGDLAATFAKVRECLLRQLS